MEADNTMANAWLADGWAGLLVKDVANSCLLLSVDPRADPDDPSGVTFVRSTSRKPYQTPPGPAR
jgi:hypothetical protein